MVDTAASSEVFSSIFGTLTQGLRIFSNNAFRRPKPASSKVNGTELEGSARTLQNHTSKNGAKSRVPHTGQEEGRKEKKKKKFEQVSSEPLSSHNWGNRRDSPSVAVRKVHIGSGSEQAFAANHALEKDVNSLHVSYEALSKTKFKKGVDSKGRAENGVESTNAENRVRRGKRSCQAASDQKKPNIRQKTNSTDDSSAPVPSDKHPISKSPEGGSAIAKTSTERKTYDSPDAKQGKKRRKLEDSVEAKYEKKLRVPDSILTTNQDPGPASKIRGAEKSEGKGTSSTFGKRKRIEGDEDNVEATAARQFDTEEKLKRTIFVGNLPLKIKKKAVIKEFSVYGSVESVRLRSVPLLDTKIPRKGAIIKGQINEAVDSQHAYVVFENTACANAALAHNMKEFYGNHLRVDAAHVPRQALKGKSALHYDPKRSIFVGNLPFDVKDEELYQTFSSGKSPDMQVEAMRVVRDPHTSISKGIAYVLFKTNAGVLPFLSAKRKVKLRDRILRISRVVASQSMRKDPIPSKHVKRVQDFDTSQPQRKRAKLSASYQGVRANKEKRKAAGKNDSQPHVSGSLRGGSRGTPKAIGSKRKRVEKHQRGISRSKKMRRT